jgi:hypothetical protein
MRHIIKMDIVSDTRKQNKMATSFFIMELEHGKYYVGASQDPLKTLEEHREGVAGVAWTQIHRPVRLREVVAVARPSELDDYVRRWMMERGVEHVRGGSWSEVRLRDKDRQALCEVESGVEKRKRGCVVC